MPRALSARAQTVYILDAAVFEEFFSGLIESAAAIDEDLRDMNLGDARNQLTLLRESLPYIGLSGLDFRFWPIYSTASADVKKYRHPTVGRVRDDGTIATG